MTHIDKELTENLIPIKHNSCQDIVLEDCIVVHNDNNNKINKTEENKPNLQFDSTTTNKEILVRLINLSIPLIVSFVLFFLNQSVVFYCVRDRPLITEAKSLLYIYYYTLSILLLWGFSVGLEINGSKAIGENDMRRLRLIISSYYTIFILLTLLIFSISYFLTPFLIVLIPCNQLVKDNFLSEIKVLSFSFPLIAISCLLGRLANIYQKNSLLIKLTVISSIINNFSCIIIIKILKIDNYGLGICQFISNFVYTSLFIIDIIRYKPFHEIDVFSIKPLWITSPIILQEFKFSGLTALNYILVTVTSEFICYIGLYISEVHFVVLSIYINIFNVIDQVFEALSNAMTILTSLYYGKNDFSMVWRIWKVCVVLIGLVGISICLLLYIFSEEILYLFTNDNEIYSMTKEYILYLVITIIIRSFHFPFSEIILVFGYASYLFVTNFLIRVSFLVVGCSVLVIFFKYEIICILIIWIVSFIVSDLVFIVIIQRICLKNSDKKKEEEDESSEYMKLES